MPTAALTMGQKVSLSTSVTWPTMGSTVSKLDLITLEALFRRTPLNLTTAFFLEAKQAEDDDEEDEDERKIRCFAEQDNDGGEGIDCGVRVSEWNTIFAGVQ